MSVFSNAFQCMCPRPDNRLPDVPRPPKYLGHLLRVRFFPGGEMGSILFSPCLWICLFVDSACVLLLLLLSVCVCVCRALSLSLCLFIGDGGWILPSIFFSNACSVWRPGPDKRLPGVPRLPETGGPIYGQCWNPCCCFVGLFVVCVCVCLRAWNERYHATTKSNYSKCLGSLSQIVV